MIVTQRQYKIRIAKLSVVSVFLTGASILLSSAFPTIQFSPLLAYTFAVHTPIFIACFISPYVAISVVIGSTFGFCLFKPPIVTARVATHLFFAVLASLYFKKFGIPKKKWHLVILAITIGLIHSLSEAAAMHFFFFPQETNPLYSIYFVLGGWMLTYSCVDFFIAYLIYKRIRF